MKGSFLIHLAAKEDHMALVKEMIKIDQALLYATDLKENLPIHYVSDLKLCKWLISRDKTLLWKENKWGKLPIHSLIEKELLFPEPLLSWMLRQAPKLIKAKDKSNHTPLDYAVQYGEWEIYKIMKSKGKKMNEQQEKIVPHPIVLAAGRGSHEIVRRFIDLDKSLANMKDQRGCNLLHLISDKELFKEILELDPTLLKGQSVYQSFPIHECFYRDFSESFVQWVIEQDMSQLSLQDGAGNLPIYYAIQAGQNRYSCLVEWILSQDNSLLRAKNSYGETLLHTAFNNGKLRLASSFIEKEPDLLFERSENGNLPHHCFSYRHDNESIHFQLWLFEKFPELMLEKNGEGLLPIHEAAQEGILRLVDYLLANLPSEALHKDNLMLMHKETNSE